MALWSELRFAVDEPGVHFPSRVLSKDLKKGIHSFPAWRSEQKGQCEGQAGKLACWVLGKNTNGMSPSLCGRRMEAKQFTRSRGPVWLVANDW